MYVLYYLLLITFFLYYYTSYAFLEWCTIRRDDCKRDFGPWFKSRKSLIFFFLADDGQKMVDN